MYAIGDVASQPDCDGNPLPELASVAKQQGRFAGKLLASRVHDNACHGVFRYRNLGTMAVIGRKRAVANFPLLRLTGFTAWLIWSIVHLGLLSDFRSRLAVYFNWTWSWIRHTRGPRLITEVPKLLRRSAIAPGAADGPPC